MDRDYIVFQEYKMYTDQKENFIERNFKTNRFYMLAVIGLILIMIYTNNIIFLHKCSATLIFSFFGIAVSSLWWMNVDSYNTLIRIKYANVIEKIEEKLPIHPFTDERQEIENYRNKKIFMFSDIQKFISIIAALFFFAIMVSEISPLIATLLDKIISIKDGI